MWIMVAFIENSMRKSRAKAGKIKKIANFLSEPMSTVPKPLSCRKAFEIQKDCMS